MRVLLVNVASRLGAIRATLLKGHRRYQRDWGQGLGPVGLMVGLPVFRSPASLWGLLEVGDGMWQIAPREEATGRQLAAVWREWKNSDRQTCSSVEGSMS